MRYTKLTIALMVLLTLVVSVAASVEGPASVETGDTETYTVTLEAEEPIQDDWTTGFFQARWCKIGHKDETGSYIDHTDWADCKDTWSGNYTATFETRGTHQITGVMVQTTIQWNGTTGVWDTLEEWAEVDSEVFPVEVTYKMHGPSVSPPPGGPQLLP